MGSGLEGRVAGGSKKKTAYLQERKMIVKKNIARYSPMARNNMGAVTLVCRVGGAVAGYFSQIHIL